MSAFADLNTLFSNSFKCKVTLKILNERELKNVPMPRQKYTTNTLAIKLR